MIDFRYHLVSLVSVFLALAIGLALGAGALRGPASDALTSQVNALREDKANLQQAVTNREATITSQDTAITMLAESAATGKLTGHTVSMIVLPGAEATGPAGLAKVLTAAGADTVSTVTVTPTWSKPSGSADRDAVLTTLSSQLTQLGVENSASQQAKLAALLARGSAGSEAGARDATGVAIMDALGEAGLVTVAEDTPRRADLVIVLAAAVGDGAAGNDSEWQTAELQSNLALVTALEAGSQGVVAVGPSGANAKGGLLAALRGADNIGASTVDVADSSLGAVATVFALIEQVGGGSGDYGTGANATAVLPAAAGPSTTGTSTP